MARLTILNKMTTYGSSWQFRILILRLVAQFLPALGVVFIIHYGNFVTRPS
jgi:hypothetical protein